MVACRIRLDVELTGDFAVWWMWQEDDDMLVPPQDFNDVIEPMEGVWREECTML